MNATRRTSAPYAPAISIEAVAAPGDRPPDGRRTRHDLRFSHDPSDHAARKHDHEHDADKQRPVFQEGADDFGSDRTGKHASDHGLGGEPGNGGHTDDAAVGFDHDGGDHRAEQECSRETGEFKQRRKSE